MLWHHFFFSREFQTKRHEVISENETVLSSKVITSTTENDKLITNEASFMDNEAVSLIKESTNKPTLEEKRKVALKEGQTLRLLALELFGDREFWVYIFQENKDLINNPNNVIPGIELIIPDSEQYNIDSENTAAVDKAKLIGDSILNRY